MSTDPQTIPDAIVQHCAKTVYAHITRDGLHGHAPWEEAGRPTQDQIADEVRITLAAALDTDAANALLAATLRERGWLCVSPVRQEETQP
jgi:hypothetical protein